jgi:hypothetical protein
MWDRRDHKRICGATVSDGVASQPLSGGSPSRLLCEGGKWILEVVRHVNVGHDLIRPTTERLTGGRLIHSYFTSNPDKEQLARAARELMQTDAGMEPRCFSAVGGRWIASSIPPPAGHSIGARPALEATPLETRVGELSAQIVLLAAVQEGLLARLARLESKLLEWGHAPPSSRVQPPNIGVDPYDADREEELASEGPVEDDRVEGSQELDPGGDEAPPDDAPAADESGLEEPPPDEELPADAEGPPEAAEPPPEERLELRLPHVSDLAKCMELLIGGELTAEEAEALPVNRTTRDCYAASLMDDTDRAIGLILMDLKATVFLGGTLMMLPRGELEQQLRSFSPGEDSIAASAEICNALSGAINGAQAQHVRASALEKFDFRRASWVTDPAERVDIRDSFGGRIVVFSRRIEQPVG